MAQKDKLHGKRVLVVGFARQGQALARWLPTIGAKVTVTDRKTQDDLGIDKADYPDVQFMLGAHDDRILNRIDVVCVSGGVPLTIPIIRNAKEQNIPLTNDAQLFLERCPAPIIGITGSAGKTTTTTLVADMIKRAGYTTWVGGNIGDVLLDDLAKISKDDVVVMELSSFQLNLMTVSPEVGAILNITPNHLDRHHTMDNYIRAKSNIIRFQRSDNIAVLGWDNQITQNLEILVKGEIVHFSGSQMVANGTFVVGDRLILAGAASFDYSPHVLVTKDEIPLRGDHNISNVLAACAIAGSLGLAIDRPGIEPDIMREAIINFQAVEHRLEIVRELDGITYVNDSIATAPERLLAALKSYDKEPLITLLGGADKDVPWDKAVSLALRKSRHIILFGDNGKKQVTDIVEQMLKIRGATDKIYTKVKTVEEAVQKAQEIAEAGDIVLFSPGGTSYDAYLDFAERGQDFRDRVNTLQSKMSDL